jgi:hypothetical protein
VQYQVDGGNPMQLNNNIYLCGRSTIDDARGFNGRLASLSLYDTDLNTAQIAALYSAGPLSQATAVATPPGTTLGWP